MNNNNDILAEMTARYMEALKSGLEVTGNHAAAIEYANKTSTAGPKAKAAALKTLKW